jgi:hypothetical protein
MGVDGHPPAAPPRLEAIWHGCRRNASRLFFQYPFTPIVRLRYCSMVAHGQRVVTNLRSSVRLRAPAHGGQVTCSRLSDQHPHPDYLLVTAAVISGQVAIRRSGAAQGGGYPVTLTVTAYDYAAVITRNARPTLLLYLRPRRRPAPRRAQAPISCRTDGTWYTGGK